MTDIIDLPVRNDVSHDQDEMELFNMIFQKPSEEEFTPTIKDLDIVDVIAITCVAVLIFNPWVTSFILKHIRYIKKSGYTFLFVLQTIFFASVYSLIRSLMPGRMHT